MPDYIIDFTDPANGSFVIKPYTTNGPATPRATTPLDAQAVTANTSIVLLGQGMFQYGERFQESVVHMLENFAYRSRPAYPIEGQIWYKNINYFDPLNPTDPTLAGLYVWNAALTWDNIAITGAMVADLDMNGFKVTDMGDPTLPQDAVTLSYANTNYVNVTGDTMTGTLIMSGAGVQVILPNAPLVGTHAVNQTYALAQTLGTAPNKLADVVVTAPLNGQVLTYNSGLSQWENATTPAGVTTFLALTDTPASYAGSNLFAVRVNAGATALEFVASTGDGYVIPGTYAVNSVTNIVTIPQAVQASFDITNIAVTNHFHTTGEIQHSLNPTFHDSYLRALFIEPYPQSQWPDGVPFSQIFNVVDQALYAQTASIEQMILQGDGVTTNFTLDFDYITFTNKLVVHNNGVKQYTSQRFFVAVVLETPLVDEGDDTGLADGAYTIDLTVNGTPYSPAATVTVAENRTIFAVIVGLGGTWTIVGNHASKFGPGTEFVVTAPNPGAGTYHVRSATNVGANTDILILTTETIPGTANTTGFLRKPYYYEQLFEDLDAGFAATPVSIFFRDSAFTIASDTVGSGSTVFISAETVLSALSSIASYVYGGSKVAITAANTGPDTFEVSGDYTPSFPTGRRFVVFNSTGNDNEYTTIAPGSTFAAGITTIYVMTVPNATGDGDIYFARDLAYTETGPARTTGLSITFTTAPIAGALIEVTVAP